MKQLQLTHQRDKVLVQQTTINLESLRSRNLRKVMTHLHKQFKDNRYAKVLVYHYASKHSEYRLKVSTLDGRSIFEWTVV